ncbi:MAG TPA: DUF4384 domain-containing protein [Pyrinomonadaceae bacterium]|nr:DUF4384 domain-containing protein [Pyrinomonadaceae bacterium]
MKFKTIFLGLLVSLACPGLSQATMAQDEDVRGAFLTSRPKASANKGKTSGAGTRPSRRRPRTTPASPAEGNTQTTGDQKSSANTPPKVMAQRLGLGLTLFMRDSNGLSVRVDPGREFHKGDRVRVLLETNADGYLYIFNTTNGGPPMMIYPDPQLDEAGNYIQSHVPMEIPSRLAAEERLKWFAFDANAGVEKLHFVFTREPLATVPIEDDLISYCRANEGKCPWAPGEEVWSRIQKQAAESAQIAKPKGLGKGQTSAEQQAVTRGIGLNRDDAEPSLIMLTASTGSDMLVATLELVHKVASLDNEEGANEAAVQVEEQPKR